MCILLKVSGAYLMWGDKTQLYVGTSRKDSYLQSYCPFHSFSISAFIRELVLQSVLFEIFQNFIVIISLYLVVMYLRCTTPANINIVIDLFVLVLFLLGLLIDTTEPLPNSLKIHIDSVLPVSSYRNSSFCSRVLASKYVL